MDTFDSLENSNVQKCSQFETELIERFFNSKSYYLHGFMSHLRNNETAVEEPMDIVAVGLLVDEIINSPNKAEKLRQLERFEQFNFYKQQLTEGIKYLESSKLSTQQMMDIVGSLGKSFAETLINLVAEKNSRDYLIELVGLDDGMKNINSNPQVFAKESQDLKEQPTKAENASIPEEPWDFFKKDVDKKIKSVQDLLYQLEKNPDALDIFKNIKNGYKDLRDWSMIHGDQGIEAISHKILLLFEAVYVRAPEERHLVIPILKDAIDIIQTINNTGPGSENLDIVRVMAHQIDKQRNTFPGKDSTLNENKKSDQAVREYKTIENHVEHENETSRDEIIEEDRQDEKSPQDAFAQGEIVPELPKDFIENLPQNDGEAEMPQVDSLNPFDQEFSEYLNEFNAQRDDQKDEPSSPLDSCAENPVEKNDVEEDLESFDSIRDSEMLSELVNDNIDCLDEIEFPELDEVGKTAVAISDSEENEEPDDVTLPGEDDQDLLELISDIQSEQNGHENYNLDSEFKDMELDTEANNDKETKLVDQTNSFPDQIPKSGNGADFVEEADMYFSFAKKALQNLMKNSSDRQALEDMELACYSLKTIGAKLGYQQVGKMMGFAENFIQKRISGQKGLKTDQVNTLFTIVDELEKAGSEKSFASPARKQWFSTQQLTLKDWISSPSEKSKKNADPLFQNEQKESTFRTNHLEDPLDFLLFDDTSKYFKQLLKD